MKRRTYLRNTAVLTAVGSLAGCVGNGIDDQTSGPTDDGPDGQSGNDGGGSKSTDSSTETQYGTLSTLVTDQPSDIDDFDSLVVTIEGIWVTPAEGEETPDGSPTETPADDDETETPQETATDGGQRDVSPLANQEEGTDEDEQETDEDEEETEDEDEEDEDEESEEGEDEEEDRDDEESEEEEDGEGGRRYREFDEPKEADLVKLQGGNTALVDEWELETGEYRHLQMNVMKTEGVLTDGSEANVETPGNAPLKFNAPFEIRADEQTRFVADFAPNRTGNGRYIVRPVATGTTVLYGDEEYDPERDSSGDGDQ